MEPKLKEQILELLRSDDGKEIIRIISEAMQTKANSEGLEFLLGVGANEEPTTGP